MLCLRDAIRAEAEALEKIASTPVPNAACPSEPDPHDFDVTSVDPEFKSLLQTSESWALDMPHVLGNISVPDIRTLRPDAENMLNDLDGDKASLYWYVMCASETHSHYDFGHDPTFHSLVDRVAFGFSLQSKERQMEMNVDLKVTSLTDELMKVIAASNIIKRQRTKRLEQNAAFLIQRLFLRKYSRKNRMTTAMPETKTNKLGTERIPPKDYVTVVSHGRHAAIDPPHFGDTPSCTCLLDAKSSRSGLHYLSTGANEKLIPQQIEIPRRDQIFAPSLPLEKSKDHLLFMNGLIRKMKDVVLNDISLRGSSTVASNDWLSCKRVREILRPLLTELGPSMFVDLIQRHATSDSFAFTDSYFIKLVLVIVSSLSKSLINKMGGKEAIIQAASLLYKHFAYDDILRPDELLTFLHDITTTGNSRTAALFLGRLLENVGTKYGKSGLHVVHSITKSHQSNNVDTREAVIIPLSTFLKWLASLKPKLSAKEMEEMLLDITCSHDKNLISMSRFVQLCLPRTQNNISVLKDKLSIIFSERIMGRTLLSQIVELCKEKDIKESGYVGWKQFLEVIDEMPVLLTKGEANQLASKLGGKASFAMKVKFSDLSSFVN